MIAEFDSTPEIHFYIDSQAAILAITSVECSSVTIYNCILSLQKLIIQGSHVTIHWVRAHDGIKLNEEADRLAKFGTMSSWLHYVPTSWSYIKTVFRKQALLEWYKRWKGTPTCRQTKLFLPCYNPRFSQFLWKLDRFTLSRLIQFVAGLPP